MRLGLLARVLALSIAAATPPFLAPPVQAQSAFELPGLSTQSQRYADGLVRRFPGGATPQQRQAAEQQAAQAEQRRDWNAAIEAWERRLGMPDAKAEQWMALARAAMARIPADPTRALNAAQQAFNMVPSGPPEIPSSRSWPMRCGVSSAGRRS
ncbi:hypothetical protein ACE7GA_02250 [Roseomonas sp. CCTCC AB2023176]|uniref:hypothetical protein n=1 Tax=Roseomonas sp. CCTCC AB2023176 TaxID=3342640 RepID=UPI0035E0DC73